jgi:hypothetical protein
VHFHSILMLAATGVISMSVPIVVTVSWLERHGRLGAVGRRVAFQSWGRILAAACSTGASAVHLAVIPEHLAAYVPAGFFFAGLAAFQLVWAFGVARRPIPSLMAVGLAVNAAMIGLWLWSRTLGFPLGAEAGAVEPVGYPDALATLLEAMLVVIAGLWLWERRLAPISRLRISQADAFVGTGLGISAVAIFTVVAMFAGHAH